MLVIGLTGGIGSGKSVVADLFAKLGIEIIDADDITRELVLPGETALAEIIETFGDSILNQHGELDRKALARVAFRDNKSRKSLELIIHPRVRTRMLESISTATSPYVILVIPLLLESGQNNMVDRVLVIDADEERRIQRVSDRDHRSTEEISDIMNAQLPRTARLSQADDLLENNGSLSELEAGVSDLHDKYLALSGG